MITSTRNLKSAGSPKRTVITTGCMLAVVLFGATQGFCQTTLNLQTQGRNADFSSFPFTRPVATGASLPVTCQVGQLFFNTTATAGANLFACTASNVWTLESAPPSSGFAAWSGITAPAGNLSISMGSFTSLFAFGSSTGSNDLFKWTDSVGNSGTGALGHFTTASGSSAIPWQADANGIGWRVNSSGQLQAIGSPSAGMIAFPQGGAPAAFPANSFGLYAAPAISSSYQWMLPAADAAGAIVSDGNGVPGHLSIVGFQGAADSKILKAGTIAGTGTLLCTDANGGATTTGCTSGGGSGSTVGTVFNTGYLGNALIGTSWLGIVFGSLGWQGVEGVNAAAMPVAGTFANLCVSNYVALDNSGSITVTLYEGSSGTGKSSTGITVTIPAGAAPYSVSCDSTHTFTATGGNEFFEYQVTDNNTGGNRYLNAITIQYH